MFESRIVTGDRTRAARPVHAPVEVRAEQLRQHFTPSEARTFGIDLSYDKDDAGAWAFRPLLSGLGAALSTVTLFTAFGFLSLLGLPDTGVAIAVVPATLA